MEQVSATMLRISLVQMLCRVREQREVSCLRESRKRSGPRELQIDLWLSFQRNHTGEITPIDTDVCDEDISTYLDFLASLASTYT